MIALSVATFKEAYGWQIRLYDKDEEHVDDNEGVGANASQYTGIDAHGSVEVHAAAASAEVARILEELIFIGLDKDNNKEINLNECEEFLGNHNAITLVDAILKTHNLPSTTTIDAMCGVLGIADGRTMQHDDFVADISMMMSSSSSLFRTLRLWI